MLPLIDAREEEKKMIKHSSKEKADSTSTVTEASVAGGGHSLSGRGDHSCFLVDRGEMQRAGETWNQLSTFA